MCEKGRLRIPGNEFIGRLEKRAPGNAKLYIIHYKSDLDIPRQEIVSAFECPAIPPFYIQTYDHVLKKRITRVIIMRGELTVLGII